jgi:mannose-6-phosphate isomerase-like protein (cupin superfamily)
MVKRNGNYVTGIMEKMRGGEGSVKVEHLLALDEMYEKGRLYALLTLEPGSSIGYHVHEGEMESYYIISGEAEYQDGDETSTLLPGDTSLTMDGDGHSIKSIGEAPLVLIAQILYK